MIILFGNRILACKPQILFRGQRVFETASRKAFYGIIQIVHTLNDTSAGEVVNQFSCLGAILSRINQLCFSRSRNAHFCIFIDISVCMTGNRDRFFPVAHARLDAFYDNRGTENGSVEHGTDRSVRALPHFFQIVLGHTRCIRRNGGTFDCYTVFLGSVCGIYGYLIVRLVSVFQSQIVIFRFQVNKREKQLIFDHFPENSGHLISIHLYQRSGHLNFFHSRPPFSIPVYCIKYPIACQVKIRLIFWHFPINSHNFCRMRGVFLHFSFLCCRTVSHRRDRKRSV